MAKQENSLAHTKRLCKYHIVFTPKYIQNQEWDDIAMDKLSAKEYENPFTQKAPLKWC